MGILEEIVTAVGGNSGLMKLQTELLAFALGIDDSIAESEMLVKLSEDLDFLHDERYKSLSSPMKLRIVCDFYELYHLMKTCCTENNDKFHSFTKTIATIMDIIGSRICDIL